MWPIVPGIAPFLRAEEFRCQTVFEFALIILVVVDFCYEFLVQIY